MLQVADPENITKLRKGEIIKTTPFEIVLIIRDFYEQQNPHCRRRKQYCGINPPLP